MLYWLKSRQGAHHWAPPHRTLTPALQGVHAGAVHAGVG
jgi:hypothetical protein